MYHVVNNNFLFLKTHIEDLTLNSNVTCDLLSNDLIPCIRIQDGVTLDCNGYSIIGPGADIGDTAGIEVSKVRSFEVFKVRGIEVSGSNVIVKNCNVENFVIGIDLSFLEGSVTVESTTVSNNDIGIVADFGPADFQGTAGSVTFKNVLAENNRVGLSRFDLFGPFFQKVAFHNAYFCNNSDQDINVDEPFGDETCPEFEATGQIFAGTFGGGCPIEDAINESLEENGFGPIVSCTDLVAQQSLLSDM